jgi:hypothetical protein
MAKATTQAANRTRAQKVKALHEQKSKERASDQATLKAMYLANRDDPLLLDVMAKAKSFISYHVKLAQDGTGARKTGYKLSDGTAEIENYFFSNDEIASEMKKAAGIQELLDYLERQITLPEAKKKTKKVS